MSARLHFAAERSRERLLNSLRAGAALLLAACGVHADPLESWNDLPSKQAIIRFVRDATTPDATTFIPAAERIAVFDNDGTLWIEQPVYVQIAFALDRVKALAPTHPEWKGTPPFDAILKGDMAAFAASGEAGLMRVMAATHAGMTTDEFAKTVSEWLATARHPRFRKPYTELAYQPMLELLDYLRDAGFKTWIVSGGGSEFMRVFAERVYGIPPEQVIGSTGQLELKTGADGKPVLMRLAKIDVVNDKAGKPVGIERYIGRRPVFAFGNSDGDQQMLEWTAAGAGPRFMGLVHHTDGQREYAYDRKSPIGTLDAALDEAKAKGWIVADMKEDWNRVFAFEKSARADEEVADAQSQPDSDAAAEPAAADVPEDAADARKPPETRPTLVFDCADGVSFTVRVGAEEVEVVVPESLGARRIVLGRAPAASGARYTADGTVFWNRGETAMFDVAGKRYTDCRVNRARAPGGEER